MNMVSLAQKYGDLDRPADVSSDEYFPSLYLEGKQIEALGIDPARVGTDMTMIATVRVASLSESKSGHRSVSFEIVEASIVPKKDAPDAASVLFPNEGKG